MEQIILPDSIVCATESQVSCDLAGEAAILDLESGIYYGLNEVGASIWNLMQEPRKVGDICELLLQNFEIDSERCQQDTLLLLRDLSKHKLIEVCDDAAV